MLRGQRNGFTRSFISIFYTELAYITKVIPEPKHFNGEDGGSKFIRNVSIICPKSYTASETE
jgi:hypothetical protein